MELFAETVGVIFDPRQRVFLPALIAAALLASSLAVFDRRVRGRRDGTAHRAGAGSHRFLDKQVWTHPSAMLDYQLLFANAGIRALLVAPLGMSSFAVAIFVVDAMDRAWGIPTIADWSTGVVTGLYTVTLFVAWDLSRYALHRLAHEVPWLWAIHKVHHSAQVMTPFTLFRVHPIERFLFGVRGVLVTGIITGVFFHFFRSRALQYELLGVNVLGFAFNIVGSNLRHSHVWLSYGPYLERLLISPAQHQIHHGDEPDEQSSNYGTWLSLWDWLGGSLRLARDQARPPRFGVKDGDANHDPRGLVSSLIGPLLPRRKAWNRGKARRTIAD